MGNKTLQDQLVNSGLVPHKVEDPAPHALRDFFQMTLEDNCAIVTKLLDFRLSFPTDKINEFYLELRRLARDLTGDPTWSVRYASQIKKEPFPFLHSAQSFQIIWDPFSPLRNPLMVLAKNEPLRFVRMPSKSHYFHRFADIPVVKDE